MANIPISIADAQLTRVVSGVCAYYGYESLLTDGSNNPESKSQFVKRMIVRHLRQCVAVVEGRIAADAASASAYDIDVS